jgi:hypothetical protein
VDKSSYKIQLHIALDVPNFYQSPNKLYLISDLIAGWQLLEGRPRVREREHEFVSEQLRTFAKAEFGGLGSAFVQRTEYREAFIEE